MSRNAQHCTSNLTSGYLIWRLSQPMLTNSAAAHVDVSSPPTLRQPVQRTPHPETPTVQDMRVDHRRAHTPVPALS